MNLNPKKLLCWPSQSANQAKTSYPNEDDPRSPTSREAVSASTGEVLAGAIATLEVLDSDLRGELDTSIPFYEVTDVETAMKHAGAIPAGKYTVFRDKSGRVFLQAQANRLPKGSRSSHRRIKRRCVSHEVF